MPWDEVGEDEGTGIVHIAPGCGAEDFQLGKALGLPVIAPLDEGGIFLDGFGSLTGRDVRDVAEPIVEDLKREGRFYRLETITHRYPHCWRCGTPLALPPRRRVVHLMGPVYDKPRETLTAGAGRRQPALPDHGRRRPDPLDPGLRLRARARLAAQHARLDDQQEALLGPGAADLRLRGVRHVRGHRRPRGAQASGPSRAGTTFEGHTPHRPYVDAVKIACPSCGAPVERITDVGNPWLDAGIVPFSTLHYREDPEYWQQWFPADFITESFPGQFRNWFYSMLAMRTVLRREPPFKTIFGYATLFGEDGRPMHKSWGNAIEFDEAAERMGVDVMRWMFAKARPEDNILFGWHAADEARRELLVLWNVYAFFVTYARLAGWTPGARPRAAGRRAAGRSTAGSCRARPAPRPRSRSGSPTSTRVGATRALSALSSTSCRPGTCACRAGGSRARTTRPTATRRSRRSTRRSWRRARMLAPILPFLAEALYGNLVDDGRRRTRPTAST